MNKSLSTGSHLNVCSANFSRLKKILNGFRYDRYSFDLLYSEKKNKADFNVISRTPHTLIIEAKLISEESSLVELILRINIYILRAETAPIVALSKLHSLQGEVS